MKRITTIGTFFWLVLVSFIVLRTLTSLARLHEEHPSGKAEMEGPLPRWSQAPREWMIGIVTGETPLAVAASARDFPQPVMTGLDVHDMACVLAADPFILLEDGVWHMFFEALCESDRRGRISLATSPDGLDWTYQGVVLEEPFHLAYPQVFRGNDKNIYMFPGIGLYRADPFPTGWTRVTNLLEESNMLYDPTLIYRDGYWWMLGEEAGKSNLRLRYSEHLESGWREHPLSPVVVNQPDRSRPGGRIFEWDGRLYRVAQDCSIEYGRELNLFEITTLTPEDYAEKPYGHNPFLSTNLFEWARISLHHFDPSERPEGGWLAVLDGRSHATPDRFLNAAFQNGLELAGIGLRPVRAKAGKPFLTRYFWTVPPGATPDEDLHVFVHFVNGRKTIFQGDYAWRKGQDYYQPLLHIPEDAPKGTYSMRIGLYSASSGKRVPLRDAARGWRPADSLLIEQAFVVE